MWKPEYEATRRAKYKSDKAYRERSRASERTPEENKEYMRAYYQANKERLAEYRRARKEERNRIRREKYATDPAFRERCKASSRSRCKLSKRNSRLIADFGIDAATYDAMLAAQDGRCAICRSEFGDSQRRPLHVDHCHTTGIIRGLLCSACNFGIGKFRDNPDLLRRAADYVAHKSETRLVDHLG